MRSRMRWTSSALARASSGFARLRSANTFPLPCSIRTGCSGVALLLGLFFFCPFRMVLRCLLQSGFHLLDFFRRGLDALLRLLLKRVQDVNRAGKLARRHPEDRLRAAWFGIVL